MDYILSDGNAECRRRELPEVRDPLMPRRLWRTGDEVSAPQLEYFPSARWAERERVERKRFAQPKELFTKVYGTRK